MAEVADKPKGNAIPEFFTEPVKLEFRSKQEGRPIYEVREFVRIRMPGDRNSMPVEPVNEEYKARWPNEYAAFKAGIEAPQTGVPLKQWPQVNTAQVLELAHFNIHTVEQLAGVTDGHIGNLGMGARELRSRAQVFLEVAAKGTGPIDRMMGEIERLTAECARIARERDEAIARAVAAEGKNNAAA